ncbi:MAG TPA: hypothetical protein VFE47_12070 [Tepidisphaeraceae bacterium]|nr:hypothetical protein [Tepidisphaeraceae bacterium]
MRMAVAVSASEAIFFAANGGIAALNAICHLRPGDTDLRKRKMAAQAFRDIVAPCVAQNKDGAIEITQPQNSDDYPQFCLVHLLKNKQGQIHAVVAMITRCKDLSVARQQLIAMTSSFS